MGQGDVSEELMFQIQLAGRVLIDFTSTDHYIFFFVLLTVHLDIIV